MILEYPNKNVYCECKFHIHKSCLEAIKEKWANKCPLCFKEYETIEINITDENNITGKIYYRLKQIDFNGDFKYSNEIMVEVLNLTDYQLFQNYPNPFNPSTSIKYSIPAQSKIKISLYDIIGNEVSTLFEGIQESGVHNINLTADNLPSGVYFVSMTAENFSKAIKITLMK